MRRPGISSYTLVEMIVAMAVLGILSALLFTVLNETSNAINSTVGRAASYTDARTIMDQINRELQESVSDTRFQCFFGATNELHFLATIDNNTGHDECEVGYCFTNHALLKSMVFANDTTNWDVTTVSTNWYLTPSTANANYYTQILTNVYDVSWKFFDVSGGPVAAPYQFFANSNTLPAYVVTTIKFYDEQDARRFGYSWAQLNAAPATNYLRIFTNVVYLPVR